MSEPPPRLRRRLPPAERRHAIVTGAARFFATNGFAATTRDLATELGITQALLYRYFPTKDALIDAIFEDLLGHWEPTHDDILRERQRPLADRLTEVYAAYFSRIRDYDSLRLFLFAALAGLTFPQRYTAPLNRRLLAPICEELRHEAGLAERAGRPMTPMERELVLTLHSGLVHLNMRRHIYRAVLPGSFVDIIALHVRVWLGGAIGEIRHLGG